MLANQIEDKFKAAVKVIRSLPKDGPYQPSQDMMLKFYGLYKQATEGPCREPKPSFFEIVKGYKWKAWSSLGDMPKTVAMSNYVEELKKIVETMSYSEDVATFIESLGPFYEYVELLELPTNFASDSNHNITGKPLQQDHLEATISDAFEVVSLCNGDIAHSSKAINSTQISVKLNMEKIEDASSEDKHSNMTNGYSKKSSYLLKKFTSDTDSDEEYSEPAETPELLQEKENPLVNNEKANINGLNEVHTPESVNYTTKAKLTTCGGGDALDAGRIRFAQTQQSQRAGLSGSEQPPTGGVNFALPGEGRGGGRRRRDSDNPSGSSHSSSSEVSVQLVMILQKIHQDLEAVVVRLDSLEKHALSQHKEVCALCQRRLGIPPKKTKWWPLPELSPRSTLFLLSWPVILHFAIKFFLLRFKARQRSMKQIS